MIKKLKFTAQTLTLSAVFLLPTSLVMANDRPELDDITMDVIESSDTDDLLNEIELPEKVKAEKDASNNKNKAKERKKEQVKEQKQE